MTCRYSGNPLLEIETDKWDSVTHPAHLSQLGQHNDNGRTVFPQHSPKVFGRQR